MSNKLLSDLLNCQIYSSSLLYNVTHPFNPSKIDKTL